MMLQDLRKRLIACDLCPNRCGCDRTQGGLGLCQTSDQGTIYQHFMHLGEEETLVPAFVINLSGCSLRCPTCSECHRFGQSALRVGSPERYAQGLARYLEGKGAQSIEWIGGEPSTQLPFVLEASEALKALWPQCPPIYLNTNAYFDVDLLAAMQGRIDAFVFDLKCMPSCQAIVGGFSDYYAVATRVIARAVERFPGGHILRHLVMPGHVACCTEPIYRWCKAQVPSVTFNLMTTFYDFRGVGAVSLSDAEAEAARALLAGGDMHNGRWIAPV